MSTASSLLRGHPGQLRRFLFDGLVCLRLVLPALVAPAATFCVNSMAQLRTALATAQNNGQDGVIRVVIGTYMLAERLTFFSSEHCDLTLQGGFVPNSNCQGGRVPVL